MCIIMPPHCCDATSMAVFGVHVLLTVHTCMHLSFSLSLPLSLSVSLSLSLLPLSPLSLSLSSSLPPQEYQQVVDAEWNILYDKLEKIVKSGAKVVLSKLPIGDVATQYFADR